MQGIKLFALVVAPLSKDAHCVWAKTLLQLLEDLTTRHRVVGDEQVLKLIRKGLFLPWHSLRVESDPVLQSEPKQLPR